MNNRREYGIVFKTEYTGGNCTSGIAKVTVFNITTQMYIDQFNASTTLPSYRLVDLYQPSTAKVGEYTFCYWISLVPGDQYSITVENSGTHNPAATSPYNIGIDHYIDSSPMQNGYFKKDVVLWHSDHPTDSYIYTITEGTTELERISTFTGDGVTDTFSVNGANHANIFVSFSVDGGNTWKTKYDPSIEWGSSSSSYTNETIDSNGYFGIKFSDAPTTGTSIKIKYVPKINRYKMLLTTVQAKDDTGLIEERLTTIRLLDYGVEMLP